MEIHSEPDRKPRYYVTEKDLVVHEGDDASDVIQWAIEHHVQVTVKKNESWKTYELEKPVLVKRGWSFCMLPEGMEFYNSRGRKVRFVKFKKPT